MAQPGCPSNDELCGFREGMQVMIFDDSGASDIFSITNVQEDALHIQHKGQDLSKAYFGEHLRHPDLGGHLLVKD